MNPFELIGIAYVLGIGGWMVSKVGDIPLQPSQPYEWTMPLYGIMSVVFPLIIGYLAGVYDRRK